MDLVERRIFATVLWFLNRNRLLDPSCLSNWLKSPKAEGRGASEMKQRAQQSKQARGYSGTQSQAQQNLAKRLAEVQALRKLVRSVEMQRKQQGLAKS